MRQREPKTETKTPINETTAPPCQNMMMSRSLPNAETRMPTRTIKHPSIGDLYRRSEDRDRLRNAR